MNREEREGDSKMYEILSGGMRFIFMNFLYFEDFIKFMRCLYV